MDTSGHIHHMTEEEAKEMLENNNDMDKMMLSDIEAEMLQKKSLRFRKNWMRNKPCICGSGKKFKKCCWSTITKMKMEK